MNTPASSLLNTPASSFLMVCLGNICRSPLAEGILQEKARAAGLTWKVDSAGTNGYHIGEAPHPLSQKVARAKGIDISQQRARKFNANDFQRFDKIYAMAEDVVHEMRRIAGRSFDPSKVELLLNELHPGKNEDVPDPYYGSEPGYHEVYKMIDAAADKIIEKYGQNASSGTPSIVSGSTPSSTGSGTTSSTTGPGSSQSPKL
ncbi:low molecular weight protein-tyrosine-phosphatase [Flavitalea sp. BT771]|uniref:low molecular weight protein-tyrosine-phosphatase n=1 Tax=Flavitalea sp. BT771 TaxID=3063329 RepID=UPI0026E435B0|nr:low molecular weight protein-tyrosine-phosphatase [Flavitalea sp. BT771]MDO6433225.1 low molecular weight protein-tyrosine-phosphatase [Flavitalea sp. BT771]MDV6221499.1 low molecular weight protein-tyrosine-phosphatase [Flavitalea sp. BT771]